jgi:predicted nuclease with TOPRIM domain
LIIFANPKTPPQFCVRSPVITKNMDQTPQSLLIEVDRLRKENGSLIEKLQIATKINQQNEQFTDQSCSTIQSSLNAVLFLREDIAQLETENGAAKEALKAYSQLVPELNRCLLQLCSAWVGRPVHSTSRSKSGYVSQNSPENQPENSFVVDICSSLQSSMQSIQQLKEDNDALDQQVHSLWEENGVLIDDNKAKDNLCSLLCSSLQESMKAIKELTNENNQLRTDLEAFDVGASPASSAAVFSTTDDNIVQQLREDLAQQQFLNDSFCATIQNSKQSINELKSENDSLVQEANRLKSELKEQELLNESMCAAMQAALASVQDLKSDNEMLLRLQDQNQPQSSENGMHSQDGNVDLLHQYRTTIQELTVEARQLRKELDAKQSETDSYLSTIQCTMVSLAALKEDFERLTHENHELEEQQLHAKQLLADYERQVDTLQASNKNVRDSLNKSLKQTEEAATKYSFDKETETKKFMEKAGVVRWDSSQSKDGTAVVRLVEDIAKPLRQLTLTARVVDKYLRHVRSHTINSSGHNGDGTSVKSPSKLNGVSNTDANVLIGSKCSELLLEALSNVFVVERKLQEMSIPRVRELSISALAESDHGSWINLIKAVDDETEQIIKSNGFSRSRYIGSPQQRTVSGKASSSQKSVESANDNVRLGGVSPVPLDSESSPIMPKRRTPGSVQRQELSQVQKMWSADIDDQDTNEVSVSRGSNNNSSVDDKIVTSSDDSYNKSPRRSYYDMYIKRSNDTTSLVGNGSVDSATLNSRSESNRRGKKKATPSTEHGPMLVVGGPTYGTHVQCLNTKAQSTDNYKSALMAALTLSGLFLLFVMLFHARIL